MSRAEKAFDSNARKLVMHHALEAKSGLNYAPDTTLEMLKCGKCGPHTIAIAEILNRWGLMWAADMREAAAAGIEIDGKAGFLENMRQAEAEIRRYMANNHLARAA